MVIRPPVLATVCSRFREDVARRTLDAVVRADGTVSIERLDHWGQHLDLSWTAMAKLRGRVRVRLFPEVAAEIGDDPASLLAGVEAGLQAALDPTRRTDPRKERRALHDAICSTFAWEVPPVPGFSDVAEIHTPCPWSGLRTVRISMPAHLSGVSSLDADLRTEHVVEDLAARVDGAIAPLAHVAVQWPDGAAGPLIEMYGGVVAVARGARDADAMARLRTARDLRRLLAEGIEPDAAEAA